LVAETCGKADIAAQQWHIFAAAFARDPITDNPCRDLHAKVKQCAFEGIGARPVGQNLLDADGLAYFRMAKDARAAGALRIKAASVKIAQLPAFAAP
jgi:hypothetical protein